MLGQTDHEQIEGQYSFYQHQNHLIKPAANSHGMQWLVAFIHNRVKTIRSLVISQSPVGYILTSPPLSPSMEKKKAFPANFFCLLMYYIVNQLEAIKLKYAANCI